MVKPEEDSKKRKKIPESESFNQMLAEIKAITSDKNEQLKLLEERVITNFIHHCAQNSNKKKDSSSSSSSLPEKSSCFSTTSQLLLQEPTSVSGIKNTKQNYSESEKQQLEEKRSSSKQTQIDLNKSEHEEQLKVQDSIAAAEEAKELLSLIAKRGYKIGKPMLREVTGSRKAVLDKKKNMIRWPVLLVYPEFMACDFIDDFCETDMFSSHLDIMCSKIYLPQPWDKQNNYYTREAVELYHEAKEEDASKDSDSGICADKGPPKWVKVDEKSILEDVLKQPDFVIQGIPVFYVVSNISNFYKEFKAGNWSPPQ